MSCCFFVLRMLLELLQTRVSYVVSYFLNFFILNYNKLKKQIILHFLKIPGV